MYSKLIHVVIQTEHEPLRLIRPH